MTKKKIDQTEKLVDSIIKGIQELKGNDIVSIDLRKFQNSVSDFFIVCHGTSNTQVEAIANAVEKEVYTELQEDPIHKEGFANAEWILLDYFNVIVHIFQKEARDFYHLEKLWADADVKEIEYQLN